MKNEAYDLLAEAAGVSICLIEPREDFDECIVTLATRNDETFAVYDRDKVLSVLANEHGMGTEDAKEYFQFNMAHMWVGDGTWAFTEDLS